MQKLQKATQNLPKAYFHLPIDGSEDPIYRERVYCYELYHQLRILWPKNSKFLLGGEVDKAGHPLIRGNDLDNTKPDFLVHTPGKMTGNFAVLEVKPIKSKQEAISKDIETLTNFLTHAGYKKGFYLFYGNSKSGKGLEIAKSMFPTRNQNSKLELWHHPNAGNPAVRIL